MLVQATVQTESAVAKVNRLFLNLERDQVAQLKFVRYHFSDSGSAGTHQSGLAFTGNIVNIAANLNSAVEFTQHLGIFLKWALQVVISSAVGSRYNVLSVSYPTDLRLGADPYWIQLSQAAVVQASIEVEYDVLKVSSRDKMSLIGQAGWKEERTLQTL